MMGERGRLCVGCPTDEREVRIRREEFQDAEEEVEGLVRAQRF